MGSILNNKFLKFIYIFIKIILFTIIFLYIGFICIQRLSGNSSVGGYRLFTVSTGSMKGVYNVNDVIAVKNYNTKNLKVGDDIAFIGNRGGLENKLVTHRIIKIEDGTNGRIFTTKGVKNSVEDPSITESQVLGKVVGVVPIVTQINHIVRSQLGFFCLIFCPLVLVIVLEILQTITDIKIENNEIEKINKNKDYEKQEIDDIPVIIDNYYDDENEDDVDEKNETEEEEIDNSSKVINIISNKHDDEII